MADFADLGSAAAERALNDALAAVEKPRPIVASPTCLACDEPLTGTPRRWCDAECRGYYERDQRANVVVRHVSSDAAGNQAVGSGLRP